MAMATDCSLCVVGGEYMCFLACLACWNPPSPYMVYDGALPRLYPEAPFDDIDDDDDDDDIGPPA